MPLPTSFLVFIYTLNSCIVAHPEVEPKRAKYPLAFTGPNLFKISGLTPKDLWGDSIKSGTSIGRKLLCD
jgi:hypothetical protein